MLLFILTPLLPIAANVLVIISFLVNISWSAFQVFQDKLPFSINKTFWIFCVSFMGIIPLFQFLTGCLPWGLSFPPDLFLKTNLLLMACFAAYALARRFFRLGDWTPEAYAPQLNLNDDTKQRYLNRGGALFLVASAAILFTNGPAHLFSRGCQPFIQIPDSSLDLLFDKVARGIIIYYTVLTVVLFRQNKISTVQITAVLLMAVLTHFPAAVPRYLLAVLYLGILLAGSGIWVRFRQLFTWVLGGVILLFFPVMSIFRYTPEEIATRSWLPPQIFKASFCGGDFDAYVLLCRTMDYVSVKGLSWGQQLLTTLFFFIPRSIWKHKSIGSGGVVNRRPGSDFVNYSSPLFAEGYIDFGCAGSIVYAVLLAILLGRYDKYFWTAGKTDAYLKLCYPAAPGIFFFLLRGDLLSSVAYSTGLFLAGLLVHKLVFPVHGLPR